MRRKIPWEGFNTAIEVRTHEPYVAVRTKDDSGRVLGTSKAINIRGAQRHRESTRYGEEQLLVLRIEYRFENPQVVSIFVLVFPGCRIGGLRSESRNEAEDGGATP